MTQEDKELLLRDLSARLSYGVICQVDDGAAGLNDGKLVEIDISKELVRFDADYYWDAYIDDVKPYLRTMSSMTEEEKDEWSALFIKPLCELDSIENDEEAESVAPSYFAKMHALSTDWLNKHHFDYRGLIEKGLAIAVAEENNPYGKDND